MLKKISLWYRATRPFSFPCSLLPVLIATAAVLPVSEWHWGRLGATVLLVLLLHVSGNMLNDYFDFASGVDTREEDDEGRPGRLLVKGQITPAQVRHGVLGSLAAAAGVSLYLAWEVDALVFPFVAAGAAGAYAYTGPPLRLKARGLGELTMLVFFGPALMAGACYAQMQRVPVPALLLSIPVGLAVSLILAGNNLRDLDEDAAGGVRTLAYRMGARRAARVFCVLAVACPVGVTAIGLARGRPLLALSLLSLLLIVRPARGLLRGERLVDVDVRSVKFMTALGLVTAGVLIYYGGL